MQDSALINLGLSSEETAIYLSLLNNGPQSASSLSSSSKVKRTYVYAVTKSLASLGLVKEEKKGKTTIFIPLSPDHLLTLAEDQKQKSILAARNLENLLPSLKTKFAHQETKPVVTYYEGIEGIKKIYLDTLNLSLNNELFALVETSKVHPDIYQWVTKHYASKRITAGIRVKAIVASGPKTETYTQLNKAELRETKVIDSKNFPFEHEINVYGHKLAIINHNKKTSPLGIIIENEYIATTFRSWFNLTWSLLPSTH
mgnify:CR=1 FL=1